MMKKNGFTLAEVLITLAIIGVVATLTLPSLMTNTGEQQAMTAYKKLLNTLNETGQMNAALEGFDYSSASDYGEIGDKISAGKDTIAAMLNERLQVSAKASEKAFGNCKANKTFVLRDGTAICLPEGKSVVGSYQNIWVDTNGPKGPNLASTCGDEGCITKSTRHIYDQFHVTLYQGVAIPGWWTAVDTEANEAADKAARFAMGIGQRKS